MEKILDFKAKIQTEITAQKNSCSKRNWRLSQHWKYFGYYLPSWNQEEIKFKIGVKASCGKFIKIPMELLKQLYFKIVERLNFKYRLHLQRTHSEYDYYNQIKSFHPKIKFYHSLWIGNSLADLFFPNIGGVVNGEKRHHGFVIEIDGSIHNHPGKMNKDEYTYDKYLQLGFACHGLKNQDKREYTVARLLEEINCLPKLDSRATKRVMRRVYIETILIHATDGEIISLITDAENTKNHSKSSEALNDSRF